MSLNNKPLCQTLSIALDTSKKIPHALLPLLRVSLTFCVKDSKLSAELLLLRNPVCYFLSSYFLPGKKKAWP